MPAYDVSLNFQIKADVDLTGREAVEAVLEFLERYARQADAMVTIHRSEPQPSDWDTERQGSWYASEEHRKAMPLAHVQDQGLRVTKLEPNR